jgi:hypothetical protein
VNGKARRAQELNLALFGREGNLDLYRGPKAAGWIRSKILGIFFAFLDPSNGRLRWYRFGCEVRFGERNSLKIKSCQVKTTISFSFSHGKGSRPNCGP